MGPQHTAQRVLLACALLITCAARGYGNEQVGCCECLASACEWADASAAPSLFGGCLGCRSKLTGDWYGRRGCLAENGITFDIDHVAIGYGVARGGIDQDFRFGGHGDYVVNADLGKLGVQEGLFLKLRAEHRYAESLAGATGGFIPSYVITDLPTLDSRDIYLTNVLFTQFFSEHFGVFAGKLDTLDGDPNAFAHGRGKDQFSNMAFVGTPLALRTIPYSTLGAGFVILREGEPLLSFSVLNPTETTKSSGFDTLFAEGVTLATELRVPVTFFGLPGHQLIGGSWSSREYFALDQDPRFLLPSVPTARESGSWSVYWNCDQYLQVYSDSPTRGWGVFARAGIADKSTNPLASFFSFGIGGDSPLSCREGDSFGVGWYYARTSSDIAPFLQLATGPLGDGQGIELYYNFAVTPWFHLTPDVQVIEPARENVDTALVLALRGKIDF